MEYIKTDDFIIEDLGIKEDWVYDIEVENNHNFFANDILVHNSIYLSLDNKFKSYCKKYNIDEASLTYEEKYEILDKFDTVISKHISEGYKEFGERINCFKNTFSMKREIIGNKGLWLAKKNYLIKMIDKEGEKFIESDKPYIKGFDTQKTSATTPWIIKSLYEYIELIFKKDLDGLYQFEKVKFEEYKKLKIDDILKPISVSALSNYSHWNDKGAQVQIKGSLLYNYIVREQELTNQFPIIYPGNKVKYTYIKEPNRFHCNGIAINDEAETESFFDLIKEKYSLVPDYIFKWEKEFLGPAKRLTKAIGINPENLKTTSFSSLLD